MQNVGSDNARRDFAYLRAVPAYRSPAPRSSRRGIRAMNSIDRRFRRGWEMRIDASIEEKTARFVLFRIEDKQVK